MMTVIKRELQDHMQSIQFAVLLGVSVVLFTASGFIFSTRCSEQASFYSRNFGSPGPLRSTVRTFLFVRPSPLLFLSEGGNKYQPLEYDLSPKGGLSPGPNEPRNYKMPEFPELDWSFIIKILFSLYVVLLGYDTISGEKELGTLRQVLSQPIGRFRLLVAKYIAIMLTITYPLLIGMLNSLLIIGILFPSIFTGASILRIALMFGLSLVYLSVFAFLSLLISSLIHQSSLSLLALLVIWVCFAIILPNTAGILSEKFSTIPSEYQTAKQLAPMIQQQIWAKIDKVRKKVDSGELKTEEDVKRETDLAFAEGQQDLIKHYESYYNTMHERSALARDLSRSSPVALFEYASEDIAETGAHQEEKFLRESKEYSGAYDEYILKKVGKVVGQTMWSFGINMMINGKNTYIGSPRPEEYRGDPSDFPQFSESQPSISRSIRDAMTDLIGLILWNMIFAAFAFRAILRLDVR